MTQPSPDRRLPGLDGVRGLAALFVVLHHCWLMAYPAFPDADAPPWNAWMAFGHLAVVVFIVLSGFSLGIGPARRQWRLGGVTRFLRRRAWRILPPYWAALAFSVVIAATVVPQPGTGPPTLRSIVVFGLLLQDVTGAPTPNGAFWSIAIEAHLYLVLPLLLLLLRRAGPAAVLAAVGVPALAVELLGPHVPAIALLDRFVPQMAVLFALGVIAAGVTSRRRPWGLLAAAAAVPPVVLIAVAGTAWTVGNYFWVDVLVGPAVALLLVALTQGRVRGLTRVLDSVPLKKLGQFSYSLYLVHAPIVVAVHYLVTSGRTPLGVPTLLVLLGTAVPLAVGFAWVFAAVFELPFQRHRSVRALRAAVRDRRRTVKKSPNEGKGMVISTPSNCPLPTAAEDLPDHDSAGRSHSQLPR